MLEGRREAMIKVKSIKFREGTMPKLERLLITARRVNNEFGLSGLQFLPSINQVQLRVSFSWTFDQNIQEAATRKRGELKKEIQEQLAQNMNEPIVTVQYG
ncbi:hypothetical protein U9M48_002049 [Paspalum notatum var. saurae]|uniref:Uncharacterized protein n=1 Tax=Paspalum notatum var. saurae TaxID=547442 RepID=A0AAQ3SD95_PASNO